MTHRLRSSNRYQRHQPAEAALSAASKACQQLVKHGRCLRGRFDFANQRHSQAFANLRGVGVSQRLAYQARAGCSACTKGRHRRKLVHQSVIRVAITFFFGITVFLYENKNPVDHMIQGRQFCASLK